MGWDSSDVVRFELGPLLQGQTSIAKDKSAYNSLVIARLNSAYTLLIIAPMVLKCETN